MQIASAVFGFCSACLFSLALTPVVRRAAARRQISDPPGAQKLHLEARPHVGGLAIFAAVVLALLATTIGFESVRSQPAPLLRGVLVAGGLIVVLGLIDDMQGSRPWKKLLTQCLAVLFLQLHVDVLGLSITGSMPVSWILLASVLALPWVVALTNAMNLIDGLDGLASGVAAASGLGLAALASALNEPVLALLAAVIAGGALGFLRSNAHPAKIFMGDTGSMFLGFGLASVGACLFWARPDGRTLASLLLIMWVPCVDMLYAIIRRWARHESIFHGDLGHVHHRLLDAGFSQRAAGTSLCGLAALSAVAGLQVGLSNNAWLWAAAVVLATTPLFWILRLPSARVTAPDELQKGPALGGSRIMSHDRAA